jgi:hypothetical protein
MGQLDQAGRQIARLIGGEPPPLRYLGMPQVAAIPDVPQVPLARYISPRDPTDIQRGLARRKPQIMQDVMRGVEQGAHRWYFNEPVRQQFIQELGEPLGNERFNLFTKMVAGTSSSAPVVPNIRKASYYMRQALEDKMPVDNVLSYDDAKRYVKENGVPEGYGSVGQAMDLHWALKYLRGQQFDDIALPGAAHKLPSFGENLRGNLMPWTGDRHEAARFGVPPVLRKGMLEKQPLPPSAYPQAERLSQKWAAEVGLSPAQFQSARWMGGASRTGVKSTDPSFSHALETAVQQQSVRTGVPPEEVLRNFIRGGGLLAVPAAMALPEDDLIERLSP